MKLFVKQGKRQHLRLAAFLIAGVLLFSSLTGCVSQQYTPTELTFSQVEYQRPDGEAVVELIEKAQQQAEEDLLPLGMIWTLHRISDATEEFYSMMTIAQVRNYSDMNDAYYSEEMEYLNTWDARIQTSYNEMFQSIQNSRFGSMSEEIFGESSVEDMEMSSQASSSDTLSLQEEEKKLIAEYYSVYAQATVTTPEGEQLYSSLEPEGQDAYYSRFLEKYNQELGGLFLKMVDLRRQMAQGLGYDSYTEIADKDLLRTSYTREQIQSFREALKETLVPVYRSYLEDFYARAEDPDAQGYIYLLGEPSPLPQGDWQDTLDSFSEVYQQMSEETGECYDYMLSHEYIDAEPSQSKANVTFSTLIYLLNTPFLFANMDGSEQDVYSISHEFGHCFAMWQQLKNGSTSEGRSLDICEIHSQAMQILTMPYYEAFYGEDADIARKYDAYTIVAGILSAAMSDEFQEIIYDSEEMTLEEINQLYLDLSKEYGLVVDSYYFDSELYSKSWFTTNQFFDTPFYAIDYALSGCVAMEFLQLALDDYDVALEIYLMLVQQSADTDFLTVLEETGLQSPFEQQQLETVAQQLEDFLAGSDSFAELSQAA